MSIVKALSNFYRDKEKRNWDKGYFFFDIHGTILVPNYKYGSIPKDFYPFSKEVLQFFSKQDDLVLALYTCSHPHEINEYIQLFEENDIKFTYVNENPEVPTDLNGYGCYEKKPYINVLFEDKAGFDPLTDWELIDKFLKEKYDTNNLH